MRRAAPPPFLRILFSKRDRHATRPAAASGRVDDFPSMKARRLLAILMREPLNYRVVRQTGSHRMLRAPGRPQVVFGFHSRELRPREVRHVLVTQVGLAESEALNLL
jgi:predicted RNA binding protein YcfA (HicA-like mRNA interferase family)